MNKESKSLEGVIAGKRTKHLPKGQIIFYEGDKPSEVYLIRSGVVKIYDIDEAGNEKILHIVKAPGIIPLAFFSGNNASLNWFYGAVNDTEVVVLDHKELAADIKKDADLAVYLMNWFSREVHELLVRLSSLGKTNALDKIIAALKFLGKFHATKRRSGWWRVNFAINQQLIADMTGVTRESAAMMMRELQLEGIIRNPRLTILEINFTKLIQLPTSLEEKMVN